MAGTVKIKDLFDVAYALREEREETLKKQAANRDVLRNFDVMGLLDEDESAELAELYPIRTRERGENAETE